MSQKQSDHRALLDEAMYAIEDLEQRLAQAEHRQNEPVAIVGIGCRFPGGAHDPDAFWRMIADGVDAVTVVPPERWDAEAYYDPDPEVPGKSYTKWGGFLENVEGFDAAFFGISPREARAMDPQQRVLLEVAWEALEHAGIAPASVAGTDGSVFVGISTHDYLSLGMQLGPEQMDNYTAAGSAHSMASGRVSYFLGLHGPNFALNTACSSSLVAVHQALHALRMGETGLALAGGVSMTLVPEGMVVTSRARMMSADGHCKSFDASADGYVRGEGCALLVLKRLADAERDGDRILAIVRGSAINQDGRSSGQTAPSGVAQEAVLRAALNSGGLVPDDISVIEAHGTGTSLGDPIEMRALGAVFGERPRETPLLVGSVKSNIGHLEAAAGAAGLIKMIGALQHHVVPPSLHFRTPNPHIPWDVLPVRVPTTRETWMEPAGKPRRGGVSSFGFSGTNAHIILEEASPIATRTELPASGPQLLVLSAADGAALRAQAVRLADRLTADDPPLLADVALTAAIARSHLAERLALVPSSNEDAAAALRNWSAGIESTGVDTGRFASGIVPEVAFLFTGQGAQYPGMGKELYGHEPVFREALDACAAIADPLLPVPLLPVMFGEDPESGRLDDTVFTQPALFAIEYALAMLWRSWGIEPALVMGHSVGEYVAACLAGVFTLEDGLRLLIARARLMGALPRDGGMAAVFAPAEEVMSRRAGYESQVSIAAVNGPRHTVLAGHSGALEVVLARCAADGFEASRLNVSHAFHSSLMDPMLDAFEQVAATVTFSAPRLGIVSNVTGAIAGTEIATPEYWRRHVREAVRFADGIATLHVEGIRTVLEIGPAPVLTGMAMRCAMAEETHWVASLRKGRPERTALLQAAGSLHLRGQRLSWKRLMDVNARRTPLPTYPFQHQRFWLDEPAATQITATAGVSTGHPLLGSRLPLPVPTFESLLSTRLQPWLRDHRIYDETLLPAAGLLEMARAAAERAGCAPPGKPLTLGDVVIRERLVVPDGEPVRVQCVVLAQADGTALVQVHSTVGHHAVPDWCLHLTARAMPTAAPTLQEAAPKPIVAERADGEPLDVSSYYERLRSHGAEYGDAFRAIRAVGRNNGSVDGDLALAASEQPKARQFSMHPGLLDAALQLVGLGMPWADDATTQVDVFLPVGVQSYVLYRTGESAVTCRVSRIVLDAAQRTVLADFELYGTDGTLVAALREFAFQRVPRGALHRHSDHPEWLLHVEWEELAAGEAPALEGEWLLLGLSAELAPALASHLTRRGARVTSMIHADGSTGDGRIDLFDDAAVAALVQQWSTTPTPLRGVVLLTGTNDGREGEAAVEAPARATLAIAKAMADSSTRLWLVTQAAYACDDELPDPAASAVAAMGTVLAAEQPALQVTVVDLPSRDSAGSVSTVAEVLASALRPGDGEQRIALRGGRRLGARLQRGVLRHEAATPQCLVIGERGVLENLRLVDMPRVPPGPGTVEIRVHATGLNFRDVLNALGMYPGDAGPLGSECAGVITAVGEDVHDLAIGDRVVAMADRSFATFALAPAVHVVRLPDQLGFVEAATLPMTFLTAAYGMEDLAGLSPRDTVLIHAATGGVGMAAIQVARRAGARIVATAGTPAKRALALALGADHVADSRSLGFEEEVRAAVGDRGVDLVLNSLAGEFIPASLRLLRAGGRFVEIGKTDIWDAEVVSRHFPDVQYHPLYLGDILAREPERLRRRLQTVVEDVTAGVYRPLPARTFPLGRAEEAFRWMGQGLHTGKIVLTQHVSPEVQPDATYLITGGLGGLGLACADWLVEQGARHVVLMGRRSPDEAATARIDRLRARGVTVSTLQGDVADQTEMERHLAGLAATHPPLRGVLHAAGALDDALIRDQQWSRFLPVFAPKVRGSMVLERVTRDLPLDFFVYFSSAAALLGAPGQANYAAANAFMDALAERRRATGRHALSIHWGNWADVGMAARVDAAHHVRWEAMGVRRITVEDGVRMLEAMLHGVSTSSAAALPMDWSRMPADAAPLFERLRSGARQEDSIDTTEDVLAALRATVPTARLNVVRVFVREQVRRVLGLPASAPPPVDRSLMDLGMDSLTAMELRNRIRSAMQVRLQAADLLRGPSIDDLATMILTDLPPNPDESVIDRSDGWEEVEL